MAKRRRFTPEFKETEVVMEALSGESSQAELCRKHNLSDEQLSKWKRQLLENAATLFEPADKQMNVSQQRIAQLEQLVGKLTLALDIQKKSLNLAELTPVVKREIVATLRTDYSCATDLRNTWIQPERSLLSTEKGPL